MDVPKADDKAARIDNETARIDSEVKKDVLEFFKVLQRQEYEQVRPYVEKVNGDFEASLDYAIKASSKKPLSIYDKILGNAIKSKIEKESYKRGMLGVIHEYTAALIGLSDPAAYMYPYSSSLTPHRNMLKKYFKVSDKKLDEKISELEKEMEKKYGEDWNWVLNTSGILNNNHGKSSKEGVV